MKRHLFKPGRFLFAGFITATLLTVNFSISHSESARGVTDTMIKIGVIIDLTGPTSVGTVPISKGIRNLTKHINDNGGIHGRQIKLIIEDDRYSIPAGVAAFKKLISRDEVLGIIGPMSMGETKVLYRHVERFKVPMVPLVYDEWAIRPYKRYLFNPTDLYDDEIGVMFEYAVKDMKMKNAKVGFCYPDVESGKTVFKLGKKWANTLGLKLHPEVLPLGLMDVTSQILSMKRNKVDVVFIHHVMSGAVALLKDMKKFGLNAPVLGTWPNCNEDTVTTAGSASKNYMGAHAFSSWYDESPGAAKMRNITLKYHPGTEKPYRVKSYTVGWVMATIFYKGLELAGENLDIETFVNGLESIKNLDTGGLVGPITYTSSSHRGLDSCKLFKADPENGKLLSITDWRRPPIVE
ncbi:MAG: ABC transporter substrate-binding protein [Thermodesulfobacteriota bacterium]|nr:ABC transporter substrate-binding protein [Thermodesulfobacteriota bacterium]